MRTADLYTGWAPRGVGRATYWKITIRLSGDCIRSTTEKLKLSACDARKVLRPRKENSALLVGLSALLRQKQCVSNARERWRLQV